MPNCFQLIRKSAPQEGPVVLQKVDEEMCAFFRVPCDPVKWYHYWYDTIGFSLAMGSSFEYQRQSVKDNPNPDDESVDWDKRTIEIIDWLDENFTTDAFAQIGK